MSSQFLPMCGGLFAGIVSLAGVLAARGVRVSEFRQAWIDALRTDIAALIAHVNAINERRFANEQVAANEAARAGTAREATAPEDYEADHADVVRIEEALAMIELRLNPAEVRARRLVEQTQAVGRLVQLDKPVNRKKLQQAERRLLETSTDYLKGEWERVKRGERRYHWVLGGSIVFGVVGFVVLVVAVVAELGAEPARAAPDGVAVPGIEVQLAADGAEEAGARPGDVKGRAENEEGEPRKDDVAEGLRRWQEDGGEVRLDDGEVGRGADPLVGAREPGPE